MEIHRLRSSRGFSLIELLVVLGILAILFSIAIPRYNDYIIRANRKAAQATLLDIASRERQYFLDARRFFNDTQFAAVGYSVPDDVSKHYTITVNNDSAANEPPRFTARATPKTTSMMATDGEITVNHLGEKKHAGADW